jgi:hypothetical protein
MASSKSKTMVQGTRKGRVATLGERYTWKSLDKPLTGEGMFIIDQFQTTLEDGTLDMIDEESVSNITPLVSCHRGDR